MTLMGICVSPSARITNIDGFSPPYNMINIDESFLAQDVHVAPNISFGKWHVRQTHFRKGSFVGNDTVVVGGAEVPEGGLIGCGSLVQTGTQYKPNQILLGIPAVEFPKPADDGKVNEIPGIWRDMVEVMLVSLLPPCLNYLSFGGVLGLAYFCARQFPFLVEQEILPDVPIILLGFPVAYLLLMVLATVMFIATKWLLVQKYSKSDYAYNSMWMFRYSAVMIAEEFWMEWCGSFLQGTELLVYVQRALGAKIGSNCLFFGYLLHQDLCQVGDNCIFETGSILQNHLWSRGQIVLDNVTVGNDCYFGKNAMVLRGAKVNDNVDVDHLTLILRNDELPSNTTWRGSPAKCL